VTTERHEIRERLAEYALLGREPGRDGLALLEAVLFLEESFPIRISDAEITEEHLGTIELMERLVVAKLGGA
jgi:acyl carrier protein